MTTSLASLAASAERVARFLRGIAGSLGDDKPRAAVYIAHPLGDGPARASNQVNAARWCAWAAAVKGVVPIANWIVLSSVWDESRRELGLAIDKQLIARCDELWHVGGRVSPGMGVERDHAFALDIPVVDLTHYGYEAPGDHIALDTSKKMRPTTAPGR